MYKNGNRADGNKVVTEPTESQASVGAAIKAIRIARGLSQNKLATLAHVNVSSISRWEADLRAPSLPELDAVLSALEASETQKRAILNLIRAPRAVVRLRELDAAPNVSLESGGAGSVRADILRALRQRRGWTQAELARAVATTRVQVARWEGGDAWPSAVHLHALCWHLNAHQGEVTVLTRPGNIAALIDPPAHADAWDDARWICFLLDLMISPPSDAVSDLQILLTRQRLTQLAEADSSRRDFAASILADVYALHARRCTYLGQPARAAYWAERGLSIVRRQRAIGASYAHSETFWFGNVITLAASARQSKRPANLRYAAKLLTDWLPHLPKWDSQYSWGQTSLAHTLARLKRYDAAIAIGKKACEDAESQVAADCAFRWRDYAQILLDAERPARAVDALNESTKRWSLLEMPADTAARHHLMSAKCFIALADKTGIRDHSDAAARLILGHGLTHLYSELQPLRAIE